MVNFSVKRPFHQDFCLGTVYCSRKIASSTRVEAGEKK